MTKKHDGHGEESYQSVLALPEMVLRRLSSQARVYLVTQGCLYATEFELPGHFARLLEQERLTPEEIGEVEHVIIQLVELDAFLTRAARLVRRELEQSYTLLTVMSEANCQLASLIVPLRKRPDIVGVASRLATQMREPVCLPDGRPGDWFSEFRSWDVVCQEGGAA